MVNLLDLINGGSGNSLIDRWGTLNSANTTIIKRRVFFSFHFADIMRVNNVRNSWRFQYADDPFAPSFTDKSLWESKKRESDGALKCLIRDGIQGTSTVCVLVGTQTWERRWVRYEIARAIVDGKGLLAVHINNLNHHTRNTPDLLGPNPLSFMGIGKKLDGRLYIFERNYVFRNNLSNVGDFIWLPYRDYVLSVKLPPYLIEPPVGYVVSLSSGTSQYCFVTDKGYLNIGSWVDQAAKQVGR